MLTIQRFVCNMLQENCYVVSDDTGVCVIIDCGALYSEEHKAIKEYISNNNLTPCHLLSTHGHIDHNFGNEFVFNAYGLRPKVHALDASLMKKLQQQAEDYIGIQVDINFPDVDSYLRGGDIIFFGSSSLEVVETPGHTQGSIMFYDKNENVIFSGDTLFRYSIGRTDFEGGSMFQMKESLALISTLPDDLIVLPGHGETTTIGEEKVANPYM